MNSPGVTASASDLAAPAVAMENKRRWLIVAMLFVASMINYFDRATISFALPQIAKTLNLGPEAKGVLLSAFFWSYALMQIPMGLCVDRLNLRWVYAAAFVTWSVAQGLTGFASTLGMLICFRVILGIGEAIYLPGGTRIVNLLFSPSERGLPCGLFDFGTRTGLMLEGIMLPWMLKQYGWQRTFVVVGFTALLWLIPWLLATPKQLRAPRVSATNAATLPPSDRRTYFARVASAILALLRNRNLLGICLGFFLFDYYWYVLVNWLPDYLVTARHLDITRAGFYTSLAFFVFGVSQPTGGWIADRLIRAGWDPTRTRKGFVTAGFLSGLLVIPAMQVANPLVTVGLIMGGCLVGLSTANMLVILQSCAPAREVGLWVGVYNFIGNLAGILAALITGVLLKKTGSYAPGFMLGACLVALAQFSYWFIVGPLRPCDPQENGERTQKPN